MIEERLVLANVPRVHFYEGGEDSPEDITFPSCLTAALRHIGEDMPRTTLVDRGKTWHRNDFCLEVMAASGIAFGLRWREGWYQDSADLMFCADPAEIIVGVVGERYDPDHSLRSPSCPLPQRPQP